MALADIYNLYQAGPMFSLLDIWLYFMIQVLWITFSVQIVKIACVWWSRKLCWDCIAWHNYFGKTLHINRNENILCDYKKKKHCAIDCIKRCFGKKCNINFNGKKKFYLIFLLPFLLIAVVVLVNTMFRVSLFFDKEISFAYLTSTFPKSFVEYGLFIIGLVVIVLCFRILRKDYLYFRDMATIIDSLIPNGKDIWEKAELENSEFIERKR